MASEIVAGVAAVVAGLSGLALIGLATWFLVQQDQKVTSTSRAIAEAAALAHASRQMLFYAPAISIELHDQAPSKSKLDRFDLEGLLRAHLEVTGPQVRAMVDRQLKDVDTYTRYDIALTRAGYYLLGTSSAAGVSHARYVRIEAKKFRQQRLPEPRCHARVRCVVSYTSPQGRNSYERSMEWDFHGLLLVLREVQRRSALRETENYRRTLERSRMTQGLRFEILQRDNYRCRGCGASADDGVTLHVDHIVAIANGGATVRANLHTLCAACNLGKGVRSW